MDDYCAGGGLAERIEFSAWRLGAGPVRSGRSRSGGCEVCDPARGDLASALWGSRAESVTAACACLGQRVRTKMSLVVFVSPGTRSSAKLAKATTLPDDAIDGAELLPLACEPSVATLTRSVVPVLRTWTKTSAHGPEPAKPGTAQTLVSPGTRLLALPEMEGVSSSLLAPLPCEPSEATLTRSVTLVSRSRTKTSVVAFVSPVTRFAASLAKATSRAALETAGALLPPLASVPCDEMLTRLVTPAATGEDGSIPSRSTTIPRATRRPRALTPVLGMTSWTVRVLRRNVSSASLCAQVRTACLPADIYVVSLRMVKN